MSTTTTTTTEQLSTPIGNSYWAETGAYQAEYTALYKQHVPDTGSASTLNGELIRAISRLVYEYNNNGNCNACEEEMGEEEYDCYTCGGSGSTHDEDEDGNETTVDCEECYGSGSLCEDIVVSLSVSEYFSRFIELINKTIPKLKPVMESVKDVILKNDNPPQKYFADEFQHYYNQMCDGVMQYILTNDDQGIPLWYSIDKND